MSLQQVPAGRNLPDDINVIIEVPMNSPAIKYEVDKASGAIFVDRMLKTAMYYPCNYGYVPHSLCGDGDPLDAFYESGDAGFVSEIENFGALIGTEDAREGTSAFLEKRKAEFTGK